MSVYSTHVTLIALIAGIDMVADRKSIYFLGDVLCVCNKLVRPDY